MNPTKIRPTCTAIVVQAVAAVATLSGPGQLAATASPVTAGELAAIGAGLLGAAAWVAVMADSVQRRGLARDRAAAERARSRR